MKPNKSQSQNLLNNSRFYILGTTVLISIFVAAWLRLEIESGQLYFIRLQQVFGLFCLIYWYIAMIISPVGYVVGKSRTKHLEFARRAIGVSAAYFALLHGFEALQGQLGGLGQISYLPSLFKWSILGGLIAFIILLILALTSFDGIVKYMTFKRWKWLHRLIYVGLVLAILHIWTIGTHLSYTNIQISAFFALSLLSGLESFRITKLLSNKFSELRSKDYFTIVLISLWGVFLALILLIPVIAQNYHSQHSNEAHGSGVKR